jgi:hypothetical protein
MQTALILEYQKSVGLHTLSRLRPQWRATRIGGDFFDEATGRALL